MLKKFFLNLLSSFVGAWIAMVLFCVVAVIVVVGVVARFSEDSGNTTMSISPDSVLVLDLSGSIVETQEPRQFDFMALAQGDDESSQPLNMIVDGIREAGKTDDVKAMYIKCGGPIASPATLNAIRESVMEFRKSGKKVYAYGDQLTMADYFVASQADSLFLNPAGSLSVAGLGGTSLFFKDFLDKIGVKMTLVKVGTFKSAAEPYISNQMSEPARAQLDTLYGNMWKYIGDAVTENRSKLNKNSLNQAADEFIMFKSAQDVLKAGFVDGLAYEREMDDIIGRFIVKKNGKDVKYCTIETLSQMSGWGSDYSAKNQVAVLYATGEIAENTKAGIDCYTLVPQITELADDDKVKALVLRVNSPGGSVFGSDQIGEALDYFKSKGKPFVVSMGDYAASGGYWISCTADKIFADPLTITGSIGIFGLFPSAEGLVHKLGITPQTVSTNPGKNISLFYNPTPEQLDVLQTYINEGYSKFVNRVAKGRKMKESRVRQIAEGRVYDAVQAKNLKLVDELGSLDDAVAYAAGMVKLSEDDYGVSIYPKYKPDVWDILKSQGLDKISAEIGQMADVRPDSYMVYKTVRLLRRNPFQAYLEPLEVKFN